MDKKDISKMKDENMKEEKRKGEVVENHTRFYHRPISDKISYALLLLVAALFLVAINYLVLEDGGTPTPGYAGTTAELYLYPTEVAVDLGETVDIEVRLDTRSNEVSAVDVSLSAWEGVTIMSIDPNYDSFATFAPIDGNGLFDEWACV